MARRTFALASFATAASGARPSKPCGTPGYKWNSTSTSAAARRAAKAAVSSRKMSRPPTSRYVGGIPTKDDSRAGAAYPGIRAAAVVVVALALSRDDDDESLGPK